MVKLLKTCYSKVTFLLLQPSASAGPKRLPNSNVQKSLTDPSPYQPFIDLTPVSNPKAQHRFVQDVVTNHTQQVARSALLSV